MKTTTFNSILNLKALLFLFFSSQNLLSQTIIMNEVSNGPSGNKEYVEFVVIDTAVTYDCSGSTPPGIDIRGWIFDDNSGYHGAGGVAAGAVRFSFDPLWSNLPLGTIILIYNDADINPAIPANDLSISDGNCRLVVPISSALFETNLTTPGAVACSYPATGWTSGGFWSSTLMANTGDCARIVNLSGCEVFSVCWASCSTAPLIYFLSGSSGTDNVWFFNDGDPNDQANWSEGCADAASCGVDEQTPGSANNAANAAYISMFNNGCSPITPISSSISSFTNATCSCDGTATVNSSGSIAGYTYVWYNSLYVPIGQTSSIATGLCAGTYHVISTSLIGCSDTSTVIITSTGVTPTVSIVPSTISICNGSTASLTATGALTYSWSPSTGLSSTTGTTVIANPISTTTYTVTGTNALGCTDTATTIVSINPLPVIIITSVSDLCENDSPVTVAASPVGGSWSGTGISSGGVFNPVGLGGIGSTVTYSFTDGNGCVGSDSTSIVVNSLPTIIFTSPDTLCESSSSIDLTASPAGGIWSGTGITNTSLGTFDPTIAGVGSVPVTYTVTEGACTTSATQNIEIIATESLVIVPLSSLSFCEGGSVILVAAGAGDNIVTWSNGFEGDTLFVTSAGNYSATYTSNCGVVNSNILSVSVLMVVPSFTLDPAEGEAPLVVTMMNTTENTLSYSWIIGDSIYDSNNDTSIIINEPGTYAITIYVTNTNGCVDSLTQTVIVYGDYGIVIPNVFTPNNDNYNDGFILTISGVKTLSSRVYNRWGQIMGSFQNDRPVDGQIMVWDGNSNGNIASDGTYAYVIEATDFNNKVNFFHGFITLITK